ncbi:Diuretic hormone class 2 [Lucilia cuprina]|uniref:Diuretic hormone class 2 n=1 Tax=Lucilia cuprina TaxID=7375 RepID=A0A0L0C9F3_LUCCU|nr:diuretic hormone class 2 isoform X1 [Lucilia sericata]KNC28074.1 Diuretic hormone class 2 [Lucilia cuprina]
MMTQKKFVGCILSAALLCLWLVSYAEAAPMPRYQSNGYYNELEEVPDDILMELMARFGQTIMRARNDLENSKRTVDFGLARGYSGTQEAKHRMGLAAANFPGGPGRRRRSETEA